MLVVFSNLVIYSISNLIKKERKKKKENIPSTKKKETQDLYKTFIIYTKRMSRTEEFMKQSEARIIIYLGQAVATFKTGNVMSVKLKIDYTYLMRLLGEMYNKGWISTRVHQKITYFDLTPVTTIAAAKKRLTSEQDKLRI